MPLGGVQYVLDGLQQKLRPVRVQQRPHAPRGDVYRADLGVEVAQEALGMASVGRQHPKQVAPWLPRVVEPKGRNAQTFVEDFGGRGIISAVGPAADVAMVGAIDRVEEQLALVEDRLDDRYVRKVTASEVRVVEGEEVSLRHILGEVVAHRRTGDGQGADVDWDALPLRHQLAVGVQDGRREVTAGVQDLRHRRAQHHLHHLKSDRLEAVLDDGKGDRVGDAGGCGSIRGRQRHA